MVKAVDMSKWGGDLTREEAQRMFDDGVRACIVAVGPGGYSQATLSQCDDALAVGMWLEAYTFWESGNDPTWWIQSAINSAGPYRDKIKRWWLDVEDNSANLRPSIPERIAEVRGCLDAFHNNAIFAHIYSGHWYWPVYMGDYDGFAKEGRLLWNSWADNDPDINGVPYGGWTRDTVAIEQYTGTTDEGGQSVDLNEVYIAPEDIDMAANFVTREEMDNVLVRLFAGSERGDIPPEQRMAIVADILGNAATKQSVFDTAASAIVLSLRANGAIDENTSDDEVRRIVNEELGKARIITG